MIRFLVFLLFVTWSGFSQKPLNSYKYIIVQEKFDFLSTPDKYQTSSLTKFLFNKHGFTAFMESDTLPQDFLENGCIGLIAEVLDNSGMFTTKNAIQLKDCYGKIIYTSPIGTSKEKDFKKAYHEAIRDAFSAIKALEYKYIVPKNVKAVKQEVFSPDAALSKTSTESNEVVTNNSTVARTTFQLLYAQPIANGFQLIDKEPKKVFEILQTSLSDVFVLKDKTGIIYKIQGYWIAEFYENGKFVVEKLEIKF